MNNRLVAAAVVAALGVVPLAASSAWAAPTAAVTVTDGDTHIESVEVAREIIPTILARTSDRRVAARSVPAAGAAPAASRLGAQTEQAEQATTLATTDRIFGSDRYATAVAISQTSHPDPNVGFGGVVIIANGLNFPDALAAGPAATSLGAPILLVPPTGGLPTSVVDEIERLRGAKGPGQRVQSAIILGKEDNVSAVAEAQLKDMINIPGQPEGVFRVAGSNRWETSAILSLFVTNFEENASGTFDPAPLDTAIVTNGTTFADAIAGGAAGGWEYAPLLLTAVGGVDGAVLDALRPAPPEPENDYPGQEITTVRILGSASTVSATVVNQIRAVLPDAQIVRYGGADRFHTAALLNAAVFEGPVYEVTLTNGLRFPDALAGAPRVNLTGGPTIPVRTECVPSYSKGTLDALTPSFVTALGNTDAVSVAALSGTACG